MTKAERIMTYIQNDYQAEHDLLGKANTRNLVDTILRGENVQVVQSQRGSSVDLTPIIVLLCTVTQGVAAAWYIADRIWPRRDAEVVDEILLEICKNRSSEHSAMLDTDAFRRILVKMLADIDAQRREGDAAQFRDAHDSPAEDDRRDVQ